MPSHYFSPTQERNNCFDCLLKFSCESLWVHCGKEMVNILLFCLYIMCIYIYIYIYIIIIKHACIHTLKGHIIKVLMF